MGTNYYAHINVCGCCNRPEKKLHIGKSSMGWTFTFRGYKEYDFDEQEYREVGREIKSYKEWLKVLSKSNVRIFNEYNEEVSLEEFKFLIRSKKKEKHNHAKMILEEHPAMNNPWGEKPSEEEKNRHWLDSEGNSFSGHVFF